jgi:hypothetical protein
MRSAIRQLSATRNTRFALNERDDALVAGVIHVGPSVSVRPRLLQ